MRRLMILTICLALAPALPAAELRTAQPEQAGMSGERLQRLSRGMQGYIDRGEVAGAVTLVARRGQIVHFEAQGLMDIDAKTPLRKDAIFRIASMTKPTTSVAVMMLFEEGRLRLTDPVSKFIPEFKNPMVKVINQPGSHRDGTSLVPANREINIRDLLTHTAGLAAATSVSLTTEFREFQQARRPDETLAQVMKRLAKLPLNFHPGTAWEYGPATDVLGYLVEVISGKPFDQFLAERIFEPLKMNYTFFYVPYAMLNRLATVYDPVVGGGMRAAGKPEAARGSKVYFSGSGGLFSTAEDYSRFSQMLLDGGAYDGTRLLGRKTVELMTQNHIGNLPLWPDLAGYRFGLGFRVLADVGASAHPGSAGSFGWGGAYGTYLWIDPKEEMFGILMVQIRPIIQAMRFDSMSLALQAIVD
jgi:CubicO group peptidase (beta-lactamase class C family)